MIVADASWIIAIRDTSDGHHREAIKLASSIGDEAVLLPELTLAECLVAPARLDVAESSDAALRAAFEIVESDGAAPLRWATLRAEAGLRLPDAIVLDAAIRHRARAIATFDERLARAANERNIPALPDPERRAPLP